MHPCDKSLGILWKFGYDLELKNSQTCDSFAFCPAACNTYYTVVVANILSCLDAGGVGSIPKPLAKSIAEMLGSGMDNGAAAKSRSSLTMVPEGSEEDDD